MRCLTTPIGVVRLQKVNMAAYKIKVSYSSSNYDVQGNRVTRNFTSSEAPGRKLT